MTEPPQDPPDEPNSETALRPTDIQRRQNLEANIRLLGASRHKYTQAKLIRRTKWLITVAFLVAGPTWYLIEGKPAVPVAAASALWIILSRVVLTPQELAWRNQGAYLADRFDTTVLGIQPSRAVRPDLVTREEINAAAERYAARRTRWWRRRSVRDDPLALLRDWFAIPARLEGPELVLACQRGSAEYARRMASEWAQICEALWVTILGATVAVGIGVGVTLNDYLVIFGIPAVPSILDAIDAARLHRDMAGARQIVVNTADQAIRERGTVTIPSDLPRALQDAAWRWRTLGPGAPDLYYRVRRKTLEKDARAAANDLE